MNFTNKYTWFIALFLGIFTIISCSNQKVKVDESGLKYQFIVDNKEGEPAQINDILVIKLKTTSFSDSVLEETDYFKMQLSESSYAGGSIEDGLGLLSVGDSAHFYIPAQAYFEQTKKIPIPANVSANQELTIAVKLLDVIPYAEYQKEQEAARISAERYEDKLLSDFLVAEDIQVEPTLSGMYYIEHKVGKGRAAQAGKGVQVHYTGYFLNGRVFDSSVERNEPFEFKLGLGQVIPGWEEGISKMKVGGKATFIIPSSLAYGGEQIGPIPPYTTLMFDVELLNVQD